MGTFQRGSHATAFILITLTAEGYEALDEFEEDIRFRVQNLNKFLNKL